MHRARSVNLTNDVKPYEPLQDVVALTRNKELVEIRAAQRTFEGAYIRTALGQFSFSLVILKVSMSNDAWIDCR